MFPLPSRIRKAADGWPPGRGRLRSAGEGKQKSRTLTNLYNARPTWLDNAHRKLDEAVFAAYGWPIGSER